LRHFAGEDAAKPAKTGQISAKIDKIGIKTQEICGNPVFFH